MHTHIELSWTIHGFDNIIIINTFLVLSGSDSVSFFTFIIQLSIVFRIVPFYIITKFYPLLVSLTEELLLPDHLGVADGEDSVDTNHVGLSFNNG